MNLDELELEIKKIKRKIEEIEMEIVSLKKELEELREEFDYWSDYVEREIKNLEDEIEDE